MKSIIIRYAEIGLKGKNRHDFEKKLEDNIKLKLENLDKNFSSVKRKRGRIIVNTDETCYELRHVFGIASFSHADVFPQDMDIIENQVSSMSKAIKKGETFRISVQRVDKKFPIGSLELEKQLGQAVVDKTGREVDLDNPCNTFYLELIENKAYLFSEKINGYGGLPVGSSGHVVCLLSTGIDSPVAAWMAMKRGCSTTFVFNYNHPLADKKEKENIANIYKILEQYNPKARLFVISFGGIQREIKEKISSRLRCIICKRFMYKVAEAISAKEDAKAIITGESIGQVASQTIESIHAMNTAVNIPILRPLIGFNKQETIDLAKEIGTFDASTQTAGKCSLLPDNPATKAKLEIIEKEEQKINMDKVKQAIAQADEF